MNIGQKINEFDISDGSVESFNRIFPNTPLNDRVGFVEIGDITSKNGELVRNLKLHTVKNGENAIEYLVHDFYPKFTGLSAKKLISKNKRSR